MLRLLLNLNKLCDKYIIINIENMKKTSKLKILKNFNFPDLKIIVKASNLQEAIKKAWRLSFNKKRDVNIK